MATVRGAVKKKEFSLSSFKEKIGVDESSERELKWIPLSKAFQDATGLLGVPIGYTVLTRGFSNCGKSSVMIEALVSAQKMGILPIIIDTENNLSREHMKLMGFDFDDEFYIMADNDFLLNNYGRKRDKTMNDATIEDVAAFINDILDKQENDELPYDILIAWDSIGSVDCIKSVKALDNATDSNNMWNAGSLEKNFKGILNNRIPCTRKTSKKYTATLLGVQKIWIDSMQGAGVIKHKGGEAFFYGARIIIHMGGIQSHGTKKIVATKDKRDVAFGIEAKIGIVKNQVNGISLEGKIISVPHGFIGADNNSIDEYKKQNLQYFRDQLGFDGEFNIKSDDNVNDSSDIEEMFK
jgi:hypothetical protein